MAITAPALQTAQFGVIGLGMMGENLALNVENHGYRVALWNHKPEKVDRFLDTHGTEGQWVGSRTLEEFVRALASPRLMLLMVPAGKAVDEMLEKLMPLLSPEDVVIDGGNSLFADTQRREAALRAAFRDAGIDALELSTDDDLIETVMRFADMRRRRNRLGNHALSVA